MSWEPELEELRRRQQLAEAMGGPEKVARQHHAGRLTVRERIPRLVDDDSFHEVGSLAGFATYDEQGEIADFSPANSVIGTARIEGRKVCVAADDFTVRGGAADAAVVQKQVYAEQLANQMRLPLARLIDGTGGGGSVKTLEQQGYTYVPVNPGWDYVVDNMSLVPVVSACLGPVAGLGAARAVCSHLCVLVEGSAQLFVAGPPLVKFGTAEDLSKEQLGGSEIHRHSGAVDRVVGSEDEAFAAMRRFLSYLPASVYETPSRSECEDPADRSDDWLLSAVPRDRRKPYRIRPILESVFDRGSVFEYACYGGAAVTALARLDGHPVGIVSFDQYKGGLMTVEAADAIIRLVDLCETFHLPLVALTDQPGILIGGASERRATIRYGARAVASVYQARVPAAEVILRRVFGVGGAGISNRHRLTRRWAWPSADWGSLPVEGGIEAAYRAEIEAAPDPSAHVDRIRSRLEAVRSPFRTAERFGIEEIIDPRRTRPLLCDWVNDAYRLLPELVGRPIHGTRP